jgi:hypothetical protein
MARPNSERKPTPNGTLKFHPLANAYPLMEGQEFEEFKAGIQEAGVIRLAVVLYEGKILDGRNRYRAGVELGLEVPLREFDRATESDPALFVQNCNDDRRHEEQEIIRRRRAARIEKVAQMRREGKSTREIAETVGTSQPQVRRDLQAATETGGVSVEPTNGKVKGKDGKTRTAKPKRQPKPKPPPEPEPEREPGIEPPEENAPSLTDAIGLPVPENLLPVFAARDLFDKARTLHQQLTATLNQIALIKEVSDGRLRKDLSPRESSGKQYWRSTDLEKVKLLINQWEPYVACCPWCLDEPQKSCKACYGAGWVPVALWKRADKDLQKQVERKVA